MDWVRRLIGDIIYVGGADKEDARRRVLLNAVLVAVMAFGVVLLVAVDLRWLDLVFRGRAEVEWSEWDEFIYLSSVTVFLVVGSVLLINRYGSYWLAGGLLVACTVFTGLWFVLTDAAEPHYWLTETIALLVCTIIGAVVAPAYGAAVAILGGMGTLTLGRLVGRAIVPIPSFLVLCVSGVGFFGTVLLRHRWLTGKGSTVEYLERPIVRGDLEDLLRVSGLDPDHARRRRLLTMMMLVIMAGCTVVYAYSPEEWRMAADFVVVSALLFILSRYRAGALASALAVCGLVWFLGVSDDPMEIIDGRTSLQFFFPILMASFVLPTWASFLAAVLSIGVVTFYTVGLGIDWFPVELVLTLLGFATLSWMAGRSVEKSAHDARAEAAKNQAVLDGIADGVLVFDAHWRVTVANPAMLALAGRPADEIVGQDIETLVRSGGADLNGGGWKAVREMLDSGSPERFEWGGRTLSASLSPVLGASGGVAGSVAVLRDVTQEVEVERAKESLFAVAAHELRTPLNAIINFANMMRTDVLPPEQRENTARRIAVNGERLLIIANNLLERAKMEAGRARLKVRPFALAELMDKVQGIMGVLAQEKGLELSSDIAEDVPATLLGDQERLQQVLINLVGNGIKFTEEGEVRVRVTLPDADHWALEVSDTGSGIPEEARDRIFEPFELAEDPATRKHAGAGLGLSIVKRMVALMGGEIGLESEVGRGSTFTVVLPLAPLQEEKL